MRVYAISLKFDKSIHGNYCCLRAGWYRYDTTLSRGRRSQRRLLAALRRAYALLLNRAPRRVGIERFRYFMKLRTEEIMLARRRSRAPGRWNAAVVLQTASTLLKLLFYYISVEGVREGYAGVDIHAVACYI
jgi:hypothetical protein